MPSNFRNLLLTFVISLLMQACAIEVEKPVNEAETTPAGTETKAVVSDYPTQDRIEYVFNCIAKHGGLTYINQYACGCKIDKIAEKLSFKEYDAARTFSQMQNTTGERAGVFRDPQQAKDLKKLLKEAEAYAEKTCFVK